MYLFEGLPIIPVLVALFALTEFSYLLGKEYIMESASGNVSPTIKESTFQLLMGTVKVLKYPFVLIRSALIGIGIGAVPAAGASIASIVHSGFSKKLMNMTPKARENIVFRYPNNPYPRLLISKAR